jgi:hemerythrin-like domain-containing protein
MSTNAPFPSVAPDFSDPLGLLRACHERIFQHCEMLERLAQHLAGKGLDQESREAAAKIHRYFSGAAKHHHADEEQDLFPRLAHQSQKLADIVQRLKREHEQLDALWEQLEPLLAKPSAIEDTAAFQALTQRFAGAYRDHARKENEEVLDVAQHLFGSDELRVLGHSMAERRGVSLPTTV